MCMVYDGENILVLNRVKKDWPGLTFPGGHVEENELFSDSVIREMKEETGLTIKDPEYVGQIVWPLPDKGINDVALLYRTNIYSGEILASKEGEVFFIKKSELGNYTPSLDFDKVLAKMLKFD
ncbi:MAG: NUDIX domain-containing protein [Bacilli bacterium]|nr:NUDIX domain-containing protein [Bacilli bacterium]